MQNAFARVVDPLATPEDAVEALLELSVDAVLREPPTDAAAPAIAALPRCVAESMAAQRALFEEMLTGMAAVLYEDVKKTQVLTRDGSKGFPARLTAQRAFWEAALAKQRETAAPAIAYRALEGGDAHRPSIRVRIAEQQAHWRKRLLEDKELDDDAKRTLCFLKNTRGLDRGE